MIAAQRVRSGQAWTDYCETLRIAGMIIEEFGDEVTDIDRAEWVRFLTRLMRNGAERFMENCEPERPRLRDTPWRQGINFQSPDQDHLLCEFIDGRHDYVIRGHRGDIPYFVIAAWRAPVPADVGEHDWANRGTEGLAEFNPAALETTSFLQSDAIACDADGSFEIVVSQKDPGIKNWLEITPDCTGLLVRNVYLDRANTQPPVFEISRADGTNPRPLTMADASANLAKAGQTVLAYAAFVRHWWQTNLSNLPNRILFSKAVYLSAGGVPDRHHGFGRWACAEDEALVFEFMPCECEYWIFQLCNMWQENLDNYEHGDGYVQKRNARYEADGSVRIIIAHDDPGVDGNYLIPFGHTHGGMSLRFINTSEPPAKVTLYQLPLSELKDRGLAALETTEPVISGDIEDEEKAHAT